MYNKVATDMNFAAREKQTAEMWNETVTRDGKSFPRFARTDG